MDSSLASRAAISKAAWRSLLATGQRRGPNFDSAPIGALAALTLCFVLLAGCSSVPKVVTPSPEPRASTHPPLLRYALSLQGVPYRWGGTSPVKGFDCSGFVQHVFRRYGVGLPRRARDMAAFVPKIPRSARIPGDLLFFNTTREPFSHVGIYLGRDAFVHASSSRTGYVMVSDLRKPYWRQRLRAVGRPRSSRSSRSALDDPESRQQ